MSINIEQISSEYLNELKEKLLLEITKEENQEYLIYKLDYFKEMTFEQISNILDKYKIENTSKLAEKIFGFFKMQERKFTQKDFFIKQKNDIEQLINNDLSKINQKIIEEKEKNEQYIKKLKEELKFITTLIEVFCENNSVDLEELKKIILSSDLSDDEKFKLSILITNTLINKYKVALVSEINQFEELIATTIEEISNTSEISNENLENTSTEEVIVPSEQQNIVDSNDTTVTISHHQLLNEYFATYNELFLEFGINSIEEIVDYFDDDSSYVDSLDLDSIEKSIFIMILSTILNKIDTNDSNISTEKYNMYLQKIDKKFNYTNKDYYNGRTNKIDTTIEILLNKIQEMFISNDAEVNNELLAEKQAYMLNIKNELKNNILSINYFNTLEKELKKIKEQISPQQKNEEKTRFPIEGFVLFDYFNEENKIPYILSDLNYKNNNSLVDNGLDGRERKTGLKEFSILIHDLIRWANPQYTLSSNPNVGDNSNQIINRVYYNNDNNHPTGILRIRPKSNSNLRFCEQTITFVKGTESFEQIKKIIQKHLPFVDISDDKDFQVFVNYASALKRGDKELYDTAIKRRDKKKSLLVKTFIDDFKGKKKLSIEECEFFDELVGLTLKTFDELRKQNDIFDFEIIDQMVGGIKPNER